MFKIPGKENTWPRNYVYESWLWLVHSNSPVQELTGSWMVRVAILPFLGQTNSPPKLGRPEMVQGQFQCSISHSLVSPTWRTCSTVVTADLPGTRVNKRGKRSVLSLMSWQDMALLHPNLASRSCEIAGVLQHPGLPTEHGFHCHSLAPRIQKPVGPLAMSCGCYSYWALFLVAQKGFIFGLPIGTERTVNGTMEWTKHGKWEAWKQFLATCLSQRVEFSDTANLQIQPCSPPVAKEESGNKSASPAAQAQDLDCWRGPASRTGFPPEVPDSPKKIDENWAGWATMDNHGRLHGDSTKNLPHIPQIWLQNAADILMNWWPLNQESAAGFTRKNPRSTFIQVEPVTQISPWRP